jgi:membrane protease YdiL (CAAX protease family)
VVRRRNRSPLEIRRLAYALMALAALAGAWSGFSDSTGPMILVLALAVGAAVVYIRAADILLDFDFRGARRQAILFTIVGIVSALIGCVAASRVANGSETSILPAVGYAAMAGGIAVGLSGLVAVLWSFAGTYAGEQIERRSREEW